LCRRGAASGLAHTRCHDPRIEWARGVRAKVIYRANLSYQAVKKSVTLSVLCLVVIKLRIYISGLKVCLKIRQNSEAGRKQRKIASQRSLSAELSTETVNMNPLDPRAIRLQHLARIIPWDL
jgi:hypothetical protein